MSNFGGNGGGGRRGGKFGRFGVKRPLVEPAEPLDYKNTGYLGKFLTPNGKIQSRKRTGATAMEQRMIAKAVKRARYMALLPYVSAAG